jgi:hypothetical protein
MTAAVLDACFYFNPEIVGFLIHFDIVKCLKQSSKRRRGSVSVNVKIDPNCQSGAKSLENLADIFVLFKGKREAERGESQQETCSMKDANNLA